MRMHGHAAHDDMKYVPKEQVEEWRAKDPIDRQARARSRRSASTSTRCAPRSRREIDAAAEEALRHADARPGDRHRRRVLRGRRPIAARRRRRRRGRGFAEAR